MRGDRGGKCHGACAGAGERGDLVRRVDAEQDEASDAIRMAACKHERRFGAVGPAEQVG
jgi:hypothetical protein